MKIIQNLITITFILISVNLSAQVGIGTLTPDDSAVLDISSTAKGFLTPRITLSQRDAISLPATGLIIYQTNEEAGFYYFDGILWVRLGRKTYFIGDFVHGGIVFWLDETSQHGLVCAKQDQSSGIRWYPGTNGNTQAIGDGIYAGKANTAIIIAAHVAIGDDNSTYAARICNELQITESGITYGDWYLPSRYELNEMYQNRVIINATATSNGGDSFNSGGYWSSTERNSDFVSWQFYAFGGIQGSAGKNISQGVRAVRTF
jgi:hypothetical protein